MVKISAAIITLNEERNIERCLQSLQGVVDEIVVVDSFSTDKTEEICLRFGARFIKNPFKGHVEQKNFAVSQCLHTWVLSLDADEALSEPLKKSILTIKENPQADGYSFNRATHFCGKHVKRSGWYPDVSLRLWNKTKGKWAGFNPHDKFYLDEGATRIHLNGDLLHYSFHTFEDLLQMTSRFSTISAKTKVENGKVSNLKKVIIYPIWRFHRNYLLYRGFLDGYTGYVVCTISAFEVFSKYAKMKELLDRKDGKEYVFSNPLYSADNSIEKATFKCNLSDFSFTSFESFVLTINKHTSDLAKEFYENGKRSNLLKVFVTTPCRFITNFLFRKGYKFGYEGFIVCAGSAYEHFILNIKLIQLKRLARRQKRELFQ